MGPSPSTSAHPNHRTAPARVAGIYLLFSLAWIWLSDLVMIRLGVEGELGFWAAVLKGSAFVLISAVVLYVLIRREVRELGRALALLRAVMEGTTDAVFVKDRDGKYLLFNEAAAQFVGKSVAEVLGKDDTQLFDAQSAAIVMARDREVMRLGTAETVEEELTASGVTRTCVAVKAPYRDEAGNVVGLVGISRDVTERKRGEAFLARQNAILERIATGSPLSEVLTGIVRMVEEQLPGAIGSILLLDHDGQRLRVAAAPHLPEEYNAAIDGVTIGPCVGSCGTAAYTRETVLVRDVATDPLWANYKSLAISHGLWACWSVPIFAAARGDEVPAVLGTFAVYAREPGDPDPRFAELIARSQYVACVAIERDRVARDLRESEERYRSLVESSADGIFVNEGGKIVYANPALARILGADSPAQLIGKLPLDVTHPDGRALARERIKIVLESRQSTPFVEQKFLRCDGSAVDVEVAGVPYYHKGQLAIHVTARDITERKRAEESVRASEQRYRDLVELSPEGVAIVHEGRFVYVNPAGASMFGLAPAALVGQVVSELLHPDDHAVSAERLRTVMQDGRGVPLRAFRLRHVDGSWRVVESCLAPCRFEGQAAVQVLARDVTERLRSEQALREREEQLRTFVDHVWAPIAMLDRDMRYIHISRRWLTDYRLGGQNIIGRSHYDVFPEIPERWKEIHRRCLAGAVERCEEDRFERADGTIQWLRWELQPWRQPDGSVGGVVMFTEDITNRKRMEEQAQQSQKMEAVGRLAGGIAHDFNNLLTVINGFSDFVLRELSVDDPHRESLTHIREAGERAARLTQQLLAYSRKAMVELKVLDLNELVAESTRLLRRIIGEDVIVSTVLQPVLGLVKVDRGQIEQVLMNLILNARDAMPTGGRISVETRNVVLAQEQLPNDPDLHAGRYACLTVTDTGVGMSEEVKANIFEPFFTTKGVGKGTGLGLAVVQGAVKQNGGHIGVESAPGSGTTFTILFPVAEHVPSPSSQFKRPVRGTETILLVEDEDAVRTITRIGLEGEGYTILTASGGLEALELVAKSQRPIDLLVTDVVMPRMGGRQLAEALRERQPDLRVLYVSGYMDDTILRHGLATATDNFLQKPFTPSTLAHKVREILDMQV